MNYCTKICHGNQEVKAWAFDAISQGAILVSGSFYANAIVGLAKKEAGCDPYDLCDKKVWGILPGSLLTLITAVGGFLSSTLMPFLGSIIDHTSKRRDIALGSAVMLVLFSALQAIINENTLIFCVIIVAIFPAIFLTHSVVLSAYLPELTDDEAKLSRYVGFFGMITFISMITFMILIVFISAQSTAFGGYSLETEIKIAQLSQILCSVISTMAFIPTFYKGLGERPARTEVESGKNLLISGFRKLLNTTKLIRKDMPAVKWYLVSNILFSSAINAIAPISLSFMIDFLRMNSFQIGLCVMIVIVSAIFGNISYMMFGYRIGNLTALRITLVLTTLNIVFISILVKDSSDKNFFYLLSSILGFLSGWIGANVQTIYVSIIPKGQESEFMGIYKFFSVGFVWIPPLIVTFLVNQGISWRIAMGTISIYFLISLFLLQLMGSYEVAKEYAEKYKMPSEKQIFDSPTTKSSDSDEKSSFNDEQL